MSAFHHQSDATVRIAVAVLLVPALLYGAVVLAAEVSAPPIPDFSVDTARWVSRQANLMPPPPGAPGARGPIGDHPEHPHFANNSGRTPTPRVGNDTNPLLLPWAAEHLQVANAAILAGGVGFDAAQRCWHPGVTGVLTFTAEPVVFLQTPDEVIILYQRNQMVRRIALNRGHSEPVVPSWMGEPVGHYEGDTLVVDTIGFGDGTFLDNFRTPHSRKLHVVERYQIVDGDPALITDAARPGDEAFTAPGTRVLQVIATVEDPGAFTMPWSTMQLYEQVAEPFEESICQENADDRFNQGLVAVPTNDRRDF